MAQDFAKPRSSQTPPARRQARATSKAAGGGSTWGWFVTGLLTGVLLTLLGYLGVQRYQSNAAVAAASSAQSPEAARLPVFDFGFYEELANAEVAVQLPVDPAQAGTASAALPVAGADSAAAAAVDNFLLQAGSFQERSEAEERRAKITLLNMTAEIVPGVVAGKTWYRVNVGPFVGRPSVEEARRTLSANNVDSLLMLSR
jgi:cell division protein FtsN